MKSKNTKYYILSIGILMESGTPESGFATNI